MVRKRKISRKLYVSWLAFCAMLYLLSLQSCAITVSLRPSATFESWLDSTLNCKHDSVIIQGDTFNYFNSN